MTAMSDVAAPEPSESKPDRATDAARHHRRALGVYAVATVLFAGAVGYLAKNGYDRSLELTGGVNPSAGALSPDSPGYEASVQPTPVSLVAVMGDDHQPVNVAVVATPPGKNGGGTVVLLPLDTIGSVDGGTPTPLRNAFAHGGLDEMRQVAESALGFGLDGAVSINAEGLATLMTGPVHIVNPDTIYEADGPTARRIVYPAGPLDLTADQAVDYLAAQSIGEGSYNRFNRALVFWAAFVQARSGASGPSGVSGVSATSGSGATGDNQLQSTGASGAVPTTAPATTTPAPAVSGDTGAGTSGASTGSGSSGSSGAPGGSDGDQGAALDLFDRLFDGPVTSVAAAVEQVDVPVAGAAPVQVFRVDHDAMNEELPSIVPFPQSAVPGQRVAVKLLNGTPKAGTELTRAADVVKAGGEVRVVGNATRMDQTTSSVTYVNAGDKAVADRIAAALKVTAVKGSVNGVDIGIVVVVGGDGG